MLVWLRDGRSQNRGCMHYKVDAVLPKVTIGKWEWFMLSANWLTHTIINNIIFVNGLQLWKTIILYRYIKI